MDWKTFDMLGVQRYSFWCSDVCCWCTEDNEATPQVWIFVGFVYGICTVRVSLRECRRGDLNPLPYANARNSSDTLTPHLLDISMRYPSNLHMP